MKSVRRVRPDPDLELSATRKRERDALALARCQRDSLESFQLLERARDAGNRLIDIELKDLVAGALAHIAYECRDRAAIDAKIAVLELRVRESEPEREERTIRQV